MRKVRKPREPSKASLREIPEIDFSKVKVRSNPWAVRIACERVVHMVKPRRDD
jgi:hypothetical protein